MPPLGGSTNAIIAHDGELFFDRSTSIPSLASTEFSVKSGRAVKCACTESISAATWHYYLYGTTILARGGSGVQGAPESHCQMTSQAARPGCWDRRSVVHGGRSRAEANFGGDLHGRARKNVAWFFGLINLSALKCFKIDSDGWECFFFLLFFSSLFFFFFFLFAKSASISWPFHLARIPELGRR